ncbi:hypothetical protein CAPTEDRAFT_212631 [Capitella teleta]|uniref:Zinc finger CCHC-type and RNA-binding motif-containing protein 1 n=1 Tax=Capitella teleta TaxID=283909 RepID=R7UZ50_CAPTE|nr:hypothetical protein CAPTEDRAFT_212631 [Capitella teleta]|eukprot:ELU11589.1 hypothetical protein CAPTEDRAFT_212631 [Capitella teleta]
MSGGLAPSRSTVYVSNFPFSLTNNDLHKIFEKYGKVVKVTILCDKNTRRSKGVAFVLFLEKESAHQCVKAMNSTEMFGRTIKCSIANDNGRAQDFIRRKVYTDKSKCYQCGESGHLSYKCPKNLFGDREPPEKKKRRRRKGGEESGEEEEEYEEEREEVIPKKKAKQEEEETEEIEEEEEDPAEDSLAAAIRLQQEQIDEEEYRMKVATGEYGPLTSKDARKKKYRTDGYFSDEEQLDDD